MVKPSLPTTTSLNQIDGMATDEAIRALNNTMKQLTKELEYSLYNLDEENFNEVEWGNITSPIYAQIEDANENIATLQLTADKFDVMVSGIGSDGLVTTASIVAAINNAGSTINIDADKINFTGFTTFLTAADVGASGSTTISGSRITTGTLNANLCSVTNLSASNITTGTLSSRSISACSITGGTISGTAISGGSYTLTGSDSKMVIDNGYIYFYNANALSNYGYIYYDDSANQLWLNCNNDIKLFASDDISIEMNGDLYIDADNFTLGNASATFNVVTRIYSDCSIGSSTTPVDIYLYGNVYINGVLTYS